MVGDRPLDAQRCHGGRVGGHRRSQRRRAERRVRALGAAAVALYLGGQVLWDVQVALGIYPVPAPSDVLFLGMVLPFVAALALAVRAHGSHRELRTFLLDGAVLAAAIVAIVLERELRENAQEALAAREASETRYRTLVDVFNRLAEQTTFANDETEMFAAAAAALAQLAPAAVGDIQAINPSADRLCVAVAWGDGALAPGAAVEIEAPDRCFGIRRGTTYAVEDATDPWTPSCPAHPAERGSVLCVPMTAAGKLLGVIHLVRDEPRSFDDNERRQASRIAEQVALAVSNTRLIRTMEGLALTYGLTGLHNVRFFDPFLDRELANAARAGTPVGVISIDLDHFKQFNDTHGHPAGDEALRSFARGCLGVLRDADTMARVGGEEF